jgi:excisionase family DNA binding protein
LSLDAPRHVEGEHSLADTLASSDPDPEEQVSLEQRRRYAQKQAEALLATLTPRERDVLIARLAPPDGVAETLDALGERCDITRERIRQIQNTAITKIRTNARRLAMVDPDGWAELLARTPPVTRHRAKSAPPDESSGPSEPISESSESGSEPESSTDDRIAHHSCILGRKKTLRLIYDGKLPAERVGRAYLVRRVDLDAYLAAQLAAQIAAQLAAQIAPTTTPKSTTRTEILCGVCGDVVPQKRQQGRPARFCEPPKPCRAEALRKSNNRANQERRAALKRARLAPAR